jgi:ribosomal protein L30/L7E
MPKSNKEKQADRVKRLSALGLKRVHNIWAHPDDEPIIKGVAKELIQKRIK